MHEEQTPLVTVVVPVYNHEKYVVDSIRSILTQTYRNIELIVINDGSKDRSHEMVLTLVEECKQRFVRFEYIDRQNKGLSATLNQALEMANGKYFSVLASDDVALPGKVSVLVSALEEKGPEFAAAFGNALFINDRAEKISLDVDGSISNGVSDPSYDNFIDFFTRNRSVDCSIDRFGSYATLIDANYLPAMSNVVRTSAILQVGGWTVGNILEDWEMWLKLSKRSRFAYVDKPLALYRYHEFNTAGTTMGRTFHPSMIVLAREKAFCAANNLSDIWLERYGSLAYDHFQIRELPLRRKLSILKGSHKRSLLLFAAKRLGMRLRFHRSSI